MVIMAVGHGFLGIDVLAQSGLEIRALQVMGGQSVTRQDGMDVAVFDELGHGCTRIGVKGKGRAHDPDDLAVVTLIFQQLVDLVVVPGKGRLAGAVLPESKDVLLRLFLVEAVGMDKNTVLAVFRAARHHKVALFQQAELADNDLPVFIDRHAVHAALLRQEPAAADLEILGENAHGMIAHGGDAVKGRRLQNRLGRVLKSRLGKIRREIGLE